jgi:uncharacterized membrane-anchored protein YhcB (DUF1043 family)
MLVIIVTLAVVGAVVSYVGYSAGMEMVSVTQTKSFSTSSTVTSTFVSTAPPLVSTSKTTMVAYVTFVSVAARDYSRCGFFTAESVTLHQGTAQVTFASNIKVDFAILDLNQYQTFVNTIASGTGIELQSYCSALFTGSSLYSLGRSTNYTGQVQVPVTGTYYFVFLNHYFQSAIISLSVSGFTSVQTTITRLFSFYSTTTRTYPTEAVNVTAQRPGFGTLLFVGVAALIAFIIIGALLLILVKSKMKRQTAKVKLQDRIMKLEAEIGELERKLAVSKSEADSVRADLAQLQGRLAESIPKAESEAKINELQLKLSNSVPRAELETIRSELQANNSYVIHLEGELSRSVPKTEADALMEKANRLEATLTETREKLNSAEVRSRDLESKLAESRSEGDTLRSRIKELEVAAARPPAEENHSDTS